MAVTQEQPINVSRGSIVRLLKLARNLHAEAVEHSYGQVWWEGYIRCCEEILDMEHE